MAAEAGDPVPVRRVRVGPAAAVGGVRVGRSQPYPTLVISGTRWFHGVGPPDDFPAGARFGDLYFDDNTGDVYELEA